MKIIVGRVQDFEPGARRIIDVGRRSIGVFRVGDRFYAVNNHCPHQGGPLCAGRTAPWVVSGRPGEFDMHPEPSLVACPWHGWEYELATGQSFLGPSEPPARSYDVAVRQGQSLNDELHHASDTNDSPVVYPQERVPGPYKAEVFDVSVEDDYIVVDTRPRPR